MKTVKFKQIRRAEIPEAWKTFCLSEILDIIGGGTPKTSNPEYWNGDIPWISVVDFNKGRRWINATEKKITSKGLNESSTKVLTKGSLIISARGTVGEIAQLRQDMAFNQSCYGLLGRNRVINDYLYYLLKNKIADFRSKTHGSVFDTITRQTFDQIEVVIPETSEQRAIAKILGDLDEKIELNHRMNKTLEAIAQALFKRWFMDAVQGELPKGWRKGVINDSIKILSGGTPKTTVAEYWDGKIPWYSVEDAPTDSDVFVTDTKRRITQAGVNDSATQILPKGTTIISARGTVGKLALTAVPMAMNQSCYAIRGIDGYPDFFTYYHMKKAVSDLQQQTHGTVFETITRQTFVTVKTVLPPMKLAQEFDCQVEPLMKKIWVNLFESRSLAALRDTLLPKLMSGKIRTC